VTSALLLIDIQNDYFEGGKNPLHQPERALENAKRVLGFFRESMLPVFHIRHENIRPGALTFLPDSFGSQIHESVAPADGESVTVKHYPSAFLKTGLADTLNSQGIEQLVVCGMMSHMCIDTTVRSAMDYSFAVTLLEDACATKDLVRRGLLLPAETVHETFMAALHGMFAAVMTTDAFLVNQEQHP
jgi:nicotinamidase-related amidase